MTSQPEQQLPATQEPYGVPQQAQQSWAATRPVPGLNMVHECVFRSGWLAWFGGENQSKATMRTINEVNAAGRKVVACTPDRWSIWKRLGWAFVLVITLGIVGRSPGIVIVSEPA
jgi:hypothetical protein